jgi:nitrate reductase NapE component
MIDPITIGAAFAIAKSTIAGVKEAIQLGKDIQECSGDILKFFEHRDTVARAAVLEKKKPGSELTQAASAVFQVRALRQAEKQLKEQLIYSGNGDVWEAIQAEYNLIVANRKREEREAEAKAKRKRENLAETVNILLIGFASILAAGFVGWGTFAFIMYKLKG